VPAFGALVGVSTSSRRPRATVIWAAIGVLEILIALVVATGAIALAASSGPAESGRDELAVAPAPPPESETSPTPASDDPPAATPVVADSRPERGEAAEPRPETDWAALLGPELEALTTRQESLPPPEKKAQKPKAVVAAATPPKPAPGGTCGTALDFVGNLDEATARAKQEHKLLFVLHVSGNFEEPGFT
jgi:hypothetical protein